MSSRWQRGQSGNPAGRPASDHGRASMRATVAEHMPAVIKKLFELGNAGDVAALKTLADKGLANAKPETRVELPDLSPTATPAQQGRTVVLAIASGLVSVEAGSQLLAGIGSMAKIAEITELAERIARLEAKEFS